MYLLDTGECYPNLNVGLWTFNYTGTKSKIQVAILSIDSVERIIKGKLNKEISKMKINLSQQAEHSLEFNKTSAKDFKNLFCTTFSGLS